MLNSLKSKIILPVIITLSLLVATILVFMSVSMSNFSDTLSNERILGLSQVAVSYLDRLESEIRLVSHVLAGSLYINSLMLEWNENVGKEQLRQDMFTYLYDRKNDLLVDSVVLADAQGNIVFRTHAPDIYGDSGLVSPTITAAILRGEVSNIYTSTPQFPLGNSASAPIWDTDGNVIGAVSVLSLINTDRFVDSFADTFNAEITVFLGGQRVATTILNEYGERIIGTYVDAHIADIVLGQAQAYLTTMFLHGIKHHAYYVPLLGWDYMPIGMFFIGFSNEQTLTATTIMQFTLLAIGVVSLLTAGAVMLSILIDLLKPLEELTQSVSQIGKDDQIVIYGGDRTDEIGNLALTIQQMMDKLASSIEREQLANQAKTRFLARMSHEIRTPMNSVLGIAELQLQKDTHSTDTEEAFTRIYDSSNLLLTIINDILDLSKVEAGKMEIIAIDYETASMIIDSVQLNLMYIGSKRIKFHLDVDENLPAYLTGDELRVKQILNNLLSNAFKYTQEGSVTLSFAFDPDSVAIMIKVTDTGQGMTKEQIASLEDGEFSRFNIEANRSIEGTGLGLNIVYQLVKMMGGDISVESAVGEGSTFTVRLPQKVKGDSVIGPETAKSIENFEDAQKQIKRLSQIEREPMPYGRVLVVDDVESNLYVAKGFLMPYKLIVDTVDSGILAIEKIKSGEVYDIIFMDHMMPNLDGLETTKILREMEYTHPIIALTANAFSDMADMFMNNGFDAYASKPIVPSQMDKHLLRYIRDKQPGEVIERARAAQASLNVGENNQLSRMFIASFLRDARNSVDIIEALDLNQLAGDDLKAYIIQAHAMKSALNNVGRKELSKKAGILEKAGRAENIQALISGTPVFLSKLCEIIEEFESDRDIDAPDMDAEEDMQFLRNRMRFISDACELFDIDGARDALTELRQINYSLETIRVMDEIYFYLMDSDFDEAGKIAKSVSGSEGKIADLHM